MSAVSKSFTALGNGPELLVRNGESFAWAVSGTFVATVKLEQFLHGGWTALQSKTSAASGTEIIDTQGKPQTRVRFRCSAFTSGTVVTSITGTTSEVSSTIKDIGGADVLQVTEDGFTVPSGKVATMTSAKLTTPSGPVHAIEATFTEAGAGTYTGSVAVPAGATILDIIVNAVALWTAATSAALDVGDVDDPDGYYIGINLKATDLIAGESMSFALAGGKAGAYIANAQVSPRYSATARVISGIVTSVGAGTAGRTRMTVVYHLPVTADIVAATQV